ncbi:hypothetical protein B6N60_03486 [Richelia sinica FACHB-800]|uniref:Uncharacterized protein n=1 Tax=Richelia sinica FACHB-800 TaxID=1357546 RepID=A0A975Y608_9NOST|nr:hypothetical protein B6N60_03486 [Richelia sinica FACHB-800]
MNENFGKPARTEVCLRHAARTEVWKFGNVEKCKNSAAIA